MACYVVNPSTKFGDPTAIRSSVMSYDISHRIALKGESSSLGGKISGGRGRPPANILIPLERQSNALQHCRWLFYIMKLCSILFVLYCRSRPKDDKSRHLDPNFEEVRGGVETWRMARWKARVEFFLSVIELLFYLLRLRRYKAKCGKTRCLQEWVGLWSQSFRTVTPVDQYACVTTKLLHN